MSNTQHKPAITYSLLVPRSLTFLRTYSHYIENTSDKEDLVYIEIYKSERVADISLAQWLALTPSDIVAQTLKVPLEFAEKIKKEKQVIVT